MNIKLSTFNDASDLICPRCGGEDMHQEQVCLYNREEDEEETLVIESSDTSNKRVSIYTIDSTSIMKNPSPRRHGLTITFYCEGCSKRSKLYIIQHKGHTFVWIEKY